MPAEKTSNLSQAQYADWIAQRLIAAGFRAQAWHGSKAPVHRVYFGENKGGERPFVEVSATVQTYGHALTRLPGWYKSPSLVRALELIGEDVLTIDDAAIGVRGEVATAPTVATTAVERGAFGSQFGRCAECGGPTRNGCHTLVRDSSGLHGWCCVTCAAGPSSRSSFA